MKQNKYRKLNIEWLNLRNKIWSQLDYNTKLKYGPLVFNNLEFQFIRENLVLELYDV